MELIFYLFFWHDAQRFAAGRGWRLKHSTIYRHKWLFRDT